MSSVSLNPNDHTLESKIKRATDEFTKIAIGESHAKI